MNREQYEMRKLVERQRALLEAIEPIVQQKVHLLNISLPKLLMDSDGRLKYEFSANVQELLDGYDSMIAEIASKFRMSE
jgi:hypothetical protein